MRGVREREEIRVVESLQIQYKKRDCRSVDKGRGREQKKRGLTHISGADPFPGLVDDALAEEVQGVGSRCREKVPQRCLGELSDGNIVRKFGVALWRFETQKVKKER